MKCYWETSATFGATVCAELGSRTEPCRDGDVTVISSFAYERDADGFTEFIYQGPDMLALQMERGESENTRVRYTMGSGLEAMRRASNGIASGDSSFYHFDWLGSTFELTDESQAVTDEYLYNAWGEVLERTGTTENPHQYIGAGRYYSAHGALLQLGLRYYLLAVARFLSRDPIEFSITAYCYVGEQPTSKVDPSGRYAEDLHNGMTEAEARRAYVDQGQLRITFPGGAASQIGAGDIGVDTAAYTIGSGWHFDNYGSRQRLHEREYQKALKAASNGRLFGPDCRESYKRLGMSLHPIQDAWGHGPATPCEHLHMPNELWIDNIHYDTKWNWGPGKVAWQNPTGITPWWWSPAFSKLCSGTMVREFVYWSGHSRSDGCMAQTERILQKYLRDADCCVIRRPKHGIGV